MLPHSPGFFTLNALPFEWAAGEDRTPSAWLDFLDQLWPDDRVAKETLQEMFGYLMTPDTSQQKMFLIRGPKRSGKGTIQRALSALVGAGNSASPTLTSMTSNFGLQPLIGKLVALIPDARVSGRADTQAVVEKLLMISGEDQVTIDRKNREAWTGALTARIVIMTNETPQLGDASGALAGRFINLSLTRSFYGNDDPGLTAPLMTELPAIFRWSLDGLDRLVARGRFRQPESGQDDADELAEVNSPLAAFVAHCCEVGAGFEIEKLELFKMWRCWCADQGRAHPGTAATFARLLRAAVPGVGDLRPRRSRGPGSGAAAPKGDEGRPRFFTGISAKNYTLAVDEADSRQPILIWSKDGPSLVHAGVQENVQ